MVLQIPQPTSKMGQLSDFHYIVLAMQYNSSKYISFKFSKFCKASKCFGSRWHLLSACSMTISTGADEHDILPNMVYLLCR